MQLRPLFLCALLAAAAFARDESPRSIKETLNKQVVILRSTTVGDDDEKSTLRLQMVCSSDSKLFLKYRYTEGDSDSDDDEDFRLQFSLRIDTLIEYVENGDEDSGYQPGDDRLVQTVSFKGTSFTDWTGTTDSTGARVYHTTNGLLDFTARVSEHVYTAEDHDRTTVMPDEVKFDIAIKSFDWQSTEASHVAVVAVVQSSMHIDRSDDDTRRIDMDGSDAYIKWDNHCVFDNDNTNCTIALSAITDDNDREDSDGKDSDNVKALIFSFVDEGTHPENLVWDPLVGSDPSGDTNSAAGPLSVALAAFAAVFALAVL